MLGGLGELPGATEDFGELQRAPGAAGAGTNAAPCSRAVRAARGAFHHGVFLHLRGDPGSLRLVLGGVAGESGGVGLGGRPRVQPDGFRTVAPVCGDVAEGPRRLGDRVAISPSAYRGSVKASSSRTASSRAATAVSVDGPSGATTTR
ncbi:hypothetical protein ACFCX0_25330 [Streptomyces sp. NPDC056352]|uniref:hypothetical protein n=1 Tax=Streptomyces sp. NPDC056352 TaxID=3345791 RepID=UPI0035E10D38